MDNKLNVFYRPSFYVCTFLSIGFRCERKTKLLNEQHNKGSVLSNAKAIDKNNNNVNQLEKKETTNQQKNTTAPSYNIPLLTTTDHTRDPHITSSLPSTIAIEEANKTETLTLGTTEDNPPLITSPTTVDNIKKQVTWYTDCLINGFNKVAQASLNTYKWIRSKNQENASNKECISDDTYPKIETEQITKSSYPKAATDKFRSEDEDFLTEDEDFLPENKYFLTEDEDLLTEDEDNGPSGKQKKFKVN